MKNYITYKKKNKKKFQGSFNAEIFRGHGVGGWNILRLLPYGNKVSRLRMFCI